MLNTKIFNNTILFFVLLVTITLGSILIDNRSEQLVSNIRIHGNIHLSSAQYLQFAGLKKIENLSNIDLRVIKDRIEKHPYVKKADVILDGEGKIDVEITEKKFKAIFIQNNSKFLITENMELLPLFKFTMNLDLPLILNSKLKKISKLNIATKSEDIKNALKIIKAISLYDQNTCENLSTIDLSFGKDIIITLSNMECSFIIGSENVVRKALIICDLVNSMNKKQTNKFITYIDLRYNNHIYLGTKENTRIDKERVL